MRWHHGADCKVGANLPPPTCPTATCPALPCCVALPASGCSGARHHAGSGVPQLG